MTQNTQTDHSGSIAVANAGLVLLHPYLPQLFERLGATTDNRFNDATAQANAVHYLQYAAAGSPATDNALLPFSNVLCGLAISHPVPAAINITDEQKELIDSMINALIAQMPVLNNCSITAFRETFLMREGSLTEQQGNQELAVHVRSYDVLLQRYPFALSVVRLPWMSEQVRINWPF